MAVKDLFSNRQKFISRKRMKEDFRRDLAFQKIAGDPRMAKIIRHPNEQRSLHRRMIKEARDGKLDRGDMEKISQDLASGKVEGISSTRGRAIAREFFPNGLGKYEPKKPQPTKSSKNDSGKKSGKILPDYFKYRAKPLPPSAKGEKIENKHASFFDAMRSVARNKKQQ